jgi:hypothetical protein
MHHHPLINGVERALGWTGPSALGIQFARGKLPEPELVTRLLTPTRLLDVLMRRSLSPPQVRCLRNTTELHLATTLPRRRAGEVKPFPWWTCTVSAFFSNRGAR